jgi:hypothetical protein
MSYVTHRMHQRGDTFNVICSEVTLNVLVNYRNAIRYNAVLQQPLAYDSEYR